MTSILFGRWREWATLRPRFFSSTWTCWTPVVLMPSAVSCVVVWGEWSAEPFGAHRDGPAGCLGLNSAEDVTRVYLYLPTKLKRKWCVETMSTSFAGGSTKSFTALSPNNFSGVVLSSNAEIRRLGEVAKQLIQEDGSMLDPQFFLASMTKGWGPRVVAVYSAGELVGIMYTKERVISGIPTGVVYGDGSLDGILLSNPVHQQNAFRVATELLLKAPGIRGARLRILRFSAELDAIRQLIASRSVDGQWSPMENNDSPVWKYHAHLPLTDTYAHFLEGLSSTTRHNFRYYRKRFEASGHKFIISHRASDRAGAERTGDLGGHGAAIVALRVVSCHDRGTFGCTDSGVASGKIFYVEARATPAQAFGFRREMDVLIGGYELLCGRGF